MPANQIQTNWLVQKDDDLNELVQFITCNFTLICRENITDVGLAGIVALNIGFLVIMGCTEITDRGLGYVGEMQTLEELTLTSCPCITDRGLAYLNQLRIKYLVINDCESLSDKGLDHLNQLPLRTLDVSYCPLISDDELPLFGNFHGDHQQVYKRRISPASFTARTNNDLAWVKKILLLDFTLECSSEITNQGLAKLVGLNIRRILFNGCENITDDGLFYLRSLPIEDLTMRACTQITDYGIERHLRELPLKQFDVSECPLILNRSLPIFGNFNCG
jgi:hypothetical protein